MILLIFAVLTKIFGTVGSSVLDDEFSSLNMSDKLELEGLEILKRHKREGKF